MTYAQAAKIARRCPSQEELGDCSQQQLSDWITAVNSVCCADESNCRQGYPTECDVGCATVFRPTYERCVEPNLNPDGTAIEQARGMGDITAQMIADAFSASLAGVPPEAWISLGEKCPSIDDTPAPSPPPAVHQEEVPFNAQMFNVNVDTTEWNSNGRRLQANDAEEIRWDTSASAAVALSNDVPACTEDRKGYFLAATIDLKDTMLFCAHNNGKMAWEGFSGLGGFFGKSLSALYEQISNAAAGTFFVTLSFSDMEQAADTIQVSNAQQCFIAGNAPAPDLTQWASGVTPARGVLPELRGPSNVAAFKVTSGGNLRIEQISVRGRTSSTGPAGLHVQSGGQASIEKCSFEDLRTVAREGQTAAVVALDSSPDEGVSAALTIATSRFIRCGPVAVSSARPLHVSDSFFIQNGGTAEVAAALSLHNASRTGSYRVSNCNFISNTGDAMYIDAADVTLSDTTFTTDTDLQGTAAKLRNAATVEATDVKINKFSEFDLGAPEDEARFTHCQVENSVDQQQPFQPMQQSCIFDAAQPSKMTCSETDTPSTFNGPNKVENQVHLQFDINQNTEPLHLIKVRTGYTLRITGQDPPCRDDPSGVLAKFAAADPSPNGNPGHFCQDVKNQIQQFKQNAQGDTSALDCNQTLEYYDKQSPFNYFFKGLFATRSPFDSGPYAERPYADEEYEARRTEYRDLKLYEVCRATCHKLEDDSQSFCDGFVAQTTPAAADIEPRFLVDAVFDVEKKGTLSLYNVAIRDGYNMGAQPSFSDFGNPSADPPVLPPVYTPPTPGSFLLCDECPNPDDMEAFNARGPGVDHNTHPQPYTPRPCPACDPVADNAGRPVPAVNLQPGGVLEAGFSQLANPMKPEWGWLVRSCDFQKHTGDAPSFRTTDICHAPNRDDVYESTGQEQQGKYTDGLDYTTQAGPHNDGECISVLSVGSGETLSLTLRKTQADYDGTYSIDIYDGDRQSSNRIGHYLSSTIWDKGDIVNVTSSTTNKVLIKRTVLDEGSGGAPDWELRWEAHWKLDFSCTPVPPSDVDVAPLMGPATIGKDGVKFVKVESSDGALNLGSATVRQSERVIIFGDTGDRDDRITVNTRFIVEKDASLTIKNVKIDASSTDTDDQSPALDVNGNASVTVQNCDILSEPAILLPSGDFAFQSTTIHPFPTPVTWNSGSINFLFRSWSYTSPLTQTIWVYESVVVPNDGDSMNNTLLVSADQHISLRGPRGVDIHVGLEGYIHVRTHGSIVIEYIRLAAPRNGGGLSIRPAHALVTVEQGAWASFQSVQRLQPGGDRELYAWIMQDWQNYGYKVVGRSSVGQNSISSLNITGPRFLGQNTTVVRLFGLQQDIVGGVISLRPDGLFGPDPQTTEEILLSQRFELLDRACAIFIGLYTDSGRNDMALLPTALDLLVPGAYYMRWELQDDETGTVRGMTGNPLAIHVYNGQNLVLNTSTTNTQVQADGTQLTVDEHASLQTQRVNFPALSPAHVFIYGRVDTDACFMVTMDQRNTIGHNADWRCIDDPLMGDNVHCRHGSCVLQDSTNSHGSCGDRVAQLSAGETCDSGDGDNSPATPGTDKNTVCRPNCQKARCGDGVVDTVDEQCDDGDANFVCDLAATVDTTLPGFDMHDTLYPSRYGMCGSRYDDQVYCGNEPVSAAAAELCVETWDAYNLDACQDRSLDCESITTELSPGDKCLRSSGPNVYDPAVVDQCRATCKRVADAQNQADPSICVKANSLRPDSCRPNCRLPYCGDGVRDDGDPGDPDQGIAPLTRWQHEQCDPGDPERGIPQDSPTGMCSRNCVACQPENDSSDQLQLAMQDPRYIGAAFNMSLCGDLLRPGCVDGSLDPACRDDQPFSLPAVSIPATHEVGIVCIELNCQTRKVPSHFDVAGSLYLQHIEISAQTAPSGGAIAMTGATGKAQIENSKFQNNQATPGNGGALAVSMGFITVVATEFISNSAANRGGALFVGADGAVQMTQVVFRGNSATHLGGAICVEPAQPPSPDAAPNLVLHGAVWADNTAGTGAAIADASFIIPPKDNGDAPTDAVYPSQDGH